MKNRVLPIILVIVGCLVLLALSFPIRSGSPPTPFTRTNRRLMALSTALRSYWLEYEQFPKGDLRDLLAVLQAKNTDGQNPRKVLFFEFQSRDFDKDGNFVDGWGHPFLLTANGDRSKITVKSLGENGVDDQGKPDDIVVEIVPRSK